MKLGIKNVLICMGDYASMCGGCDRENRFGLMLLSAVKKQKIKLCGIHDIKIAEIRVRKLEQIYTYLANSISLVDG
jgi:predicted Fe-S protein YdhL (DUF1289 family)